MGEEKDEDSAVGNYVRTLLVSALACSECGSDSQRREGATLKDDLVTVQRHVAHLEGKLAEQEKVLTQLAEQEQHIAELETKIKQQERLIQHHQSCSCAV